jgi:prefoldin beta subunit
MMLHETEKALEEVKKADDKAVLYKAAGELLIKAKKDEVEKDLEEKKDSLDVRMKSLARQEERIQAKFQQLQDQIKQALGKGAPSGKEAS